MRRRTLLAGIGASLPAALAGCSETADDDGTGGEGADPGSGSSIEYERWIPHTPGDPVTRVFVYDHSILHEVDAAAEWIYDDRDADVYGVGLDELVSSIFVEGSGWSAEVLRGAFEEDGFENAYERDNENVELTETDSYGDYRVFADDEIVVGIDDETVIETTDGRDRFEGIVDAGTGSGPRLVDEDDDFDRFVDETSSYRDIVGVNRNLDTVEGFDVGDAETAFVEVAAFSDEEAVEPYDEVRRPRELTDWDRYDATYEHVVDGRFLRVEGSVATDDYVDQ